MHPLGNCSYLTFRGMWTARNHIANPDNNAVVKIPQPVIFFTQSINIAPFSMTATCQLACLQAQVLYAGSFGHISWVGFLSYSLTPNCDFASTKNGFKLFFFSSPSSDQWFHKKDIMLFFRSAPFMHLVILACFIVKNRLLLFCAAVTPAEPGEWELVCALRDSIHSIVS